MTAYVLVEMEVTDPESYKAYPPLARESVERHGGRFIVRGGETEVYEGEWKPRIVVLEFESLDAIREWYHSDDYQECLPIRLAATDGRLVAVDGYAP